MSSHLLSLGPFVVDLVRHEVRGPRGTTRLTSTEAALVAHLAKRAGAVVSRAELLQEVWGYHPKSRSRAVDHAVMRLRRKLELEPDHPRYFLSVYGVGYRLELDEPDAEPTAFEQRFLPDGASPFVGRRRDLAALDGTQEALICIVGPGGVGKTRLALRWATRVIRRGATVCFAELAGARTPDDILAAVERALGLGGRAPGFEARLDRVASVLGAEPTVLVLDNFEQLVEHAHVVQALSDRCPDVRIVVTSRVAPDLQGFVLPVGGLDEAAAAALFVHRGRPHRPALSLEDALVTEITGLLESHPLALELAAARLDVLDPPRLRTYLDTHGVPGGGGSGRHATMDAVLAWSWDLLEPRDQETWLQAGLFATSFDADAAMEVMDVGGDVLRGLGVLLAHHLLRRRGDRFDMAPPVAAWARHRLAGHPRLDLLRRRRAEWAAGLAGHRLAERWDEEAFDRLALEADNIRLCFEESLDTDPELATRALLGVLYEIAVNWGVEPVIALWERALRSLPPGQTRAAVHVRLARLLRLSGDAQGAIPHLERAIERLGDDPVRHADAVGELGTTMCQIGDLTAGERLFRQAQAEHDAVGSSARGLYTGNLAALALADGRLDEAERLLHRALDETADGGTPHNHGRNLLNLASVYLARGRPDLAVRPTGRARELLAQLRDPVALGQAEAGAVVMLADLGDLDAARAQAETSLELNRSVGNRSSVANTVLARGDVLLEQGHLQDADEDLRTAVALYDRLGRKRWQGIARAHHARVLVARNEAAAARRRCDEALAWLEEAGDTSTQLWVHVLRAILEAREGEPHQAHLGRARALLRRGQPCSAVLVEVVDAWGRGEPADVGEVQTQDLRLARALLPRMS